MWWRTTAAAVSLASGVGLMPPSSAMAAGGAAIEPTDAGAVAVVGAFNQSREVSEGDSNTVFTLRLPDRASCPGDSANDDWRVQSFVVPADVDPGSLRYGGIRPVGENMHALYEVTTSPYVQMMTDQNTGPGQPGRILTHPPLSFAVFPPGTLPDGRYRIGIVCTHDQVPGTYWETEIVVSAAPEVQPGQMRWRVVDPVAATTIGGGVPWAALAVGALVTGAVLAVLRQRAGRRPAALELVMSDPKERR